MKDQIDSNMSRCHTAAVTLLLVLIVVASAPLADHEIRVQGAKSVWDGVYTAEQATRGEVAYQKECAVCHLDNLRGEAFAPALIDYTFTSRWQESTVGELFTVMKATMPADLTDRLPDADYAAIVAYLLKMNKFPAGEQELSTNADDLNQITFEKP